MISRLLTIFLAQKSTAYIYNVSRVEKGRLGRTSASAAYRQQEVQSVP